MRLSGVPGIDLDKIVEQAVRNVYDRKVHAGELDADTWAATVRALWKGASRPLGIRTGYQKHLDDEMAAALRRNLMVFAAFKNHHQVEDIAALLLDANGQQRPWPEFRDLARQISRDYNRTWLEAEYNTAVSSAQAAAQWKDVERNRRALPMLRYVTAGDERVRQAHQVLDGVTLPIDAPFWDEYYPPNGWRCRCDVQQVAGPRRDAPATLPDDKSVPPTFRNNPGKSGQVFTMQHPYFSLLKSEQRERILRAAGRLIFDNYDKGQYWKQTAKAAERFKVLRNMGDIVGYDPATGGFIVVHKGHMEAGLVDELPVLSILKARGEMLELLNEQRKGARYDLFWDGKFWDIKRLRSATNVRNAVERMFRDCKKQNKQNILIHIDQAWTDDELRTALYHALRNNQEIKGVHLVWSSGRSKRLTPQMIQEKDWK